MPNCLKSCVHLGYFKGASGFAASPSIFQRQGPVYWQRIPHLMYWWGDGGVAPVCVA